MTSQPTAERVPRSGAATAAPGRATVFFAAALTVAMLLLGFVGWLAYTNQTSSNGANDAVVHTLEVLDHLDRDELAAAELQALRGDLPSLGTTEATGT